MDNPGDTRRAPGSDHNIKGGSMHRVTSLVPVLAVLVSASLAGPALAAPISEWSFTIVNSWDPGGTVWNSTGSTPSNAFGTGTTLPDGQDPAGDYAFVRWGTPEQTGGNRSFLGADTNLTQSSVLTNGPAATGASFYHGNYSVRTGAGNEAQLKSTRLVSDIMISSVTPVGTEATLHRTFDIDFTETLNARLNQNVPIEECPGYETWGDSGATGACPDRLTLNTSALRFTTGIIDGYVYDFVVSFDLSTLENIVGISVDGDLATIWTGEGVLSRIGTLVTVTARAVPEPGAVALLGAGLAAMGLGLRRRRS